MSKRHTTHLTFRSQVIIRKPKFSKFEVQKWAQQIVVKSLFSNLDLDIHKIHIHTTLSFNLTFRSQVIIWKLSVVWMCIL